MFDPQANVTVAALLCIYNNNFEKKILLFSFLCGTMFCL